MGAAILDMLERQETTNLLSFAVFNINGNTTKSNFTSYQKKRHKDI